MFVSGAPLRSPGPRGEQLVDASFVLWWSPAATPSTVRLPDNDWVHSGEVVLSTDPDHPVGTPVKAGEELALGGWTSSSCGDLSRDPERGPHLGCGPCFGQDDRGFAPW